MHRREAVKNVAFLIGSALSATTIAAIFEGCANPETKGKGIFSSDQEKMLVEISDIIIPTTKMSPGAKAANVGPFISMMMADCYPEDAQTTFKAGLEEINKNSQTQFKKDFINLSAEERLTIISALRESTLASMDEEKKIKEAKAEEEKLKPKVEKPYHATEEPPKPKMYFFAMMRDLSILGFFTSEVGATQAYNYVEIPGRYDGCVDLKEGQRVWA